MEIKNQEYHKSKAVSDPQSATHKMWLGGYMLFSLGSLCIYFLLRLEVFHVLGAYQDLLKKISMAAFFAFLILAIAKYLEGIMARRTHSKAVLYNLIRLIRLLSVILVILVFITLLFQNWYTAAVSLGLISLILGFALQTPISSFIGWLYIILRNPYRVGDRIQVDTFKGDVVEIGYLDTTLWEFGGDYMTSDLPTGRLIRFPNSLVFQSAVYNYSWRKFPYIWNEIPFHLAYESDFEFVALTLRNIAKAELGEDMEEHVEQLKHLIHQTAIDKLEIKEYPFVTFRTNTNTWIEATLVYLVPPRQSSHIRSNILRKGVQALLKEPERVLFPKSNNR